MGLYSAYRNMVATQRTNGLDILIRPNLPALWGIGSESSKSGRISDRFIFKVNSTVMYAAMLVIPVAFECQAYYRLSQKFGYRDIFLWISLVIAAIFGICSAVYVLLEQYGADPG